MQKPLQTADLIALLARVAKQDRSAFSALYSATSAKLYGVVWRILPAKDRADDVLQDVYVTIWRRADRFDPARASVTTWISTIARNRAIDRLRARGPLAQAEPVEELQVADDAPGAESLLAAADDAARLQGCLSELDARTQAGDARDSTPWWLPHPRQSCGIRIAGLDTPSPAAFPRALDPQDARSARGGHPPRSRRAPSARRCRRASPARRP